MGIELDQLLSFRGNKYVFTKASMKAIEKVGNIKGYKEDDNEKLVIKVLNLMLDNKVKFIYDENKETDK